jgi:sulfite exporter TauE/SafE
MLASITPLGERGRGNRWWLTALAYEAGSIVGGAAMGAAAGAIGLPLAHVLLASALARAVAAAAVTAVALALEIGTLNARSRLPGPRRQVDKAWLDRYRGWVYGGGFGLQLGTGLVTIVNSASMYALVGLLIAMGSPATGAAVGAIFGLARALPLLAFGRARDFVSLQQVHRRLDRLAMSSRVGTVGVLAAVSLLLVVVSAAAR